MLETIRRICEATIRTYVIPEVRWGTATTVGASGVSVTIPGSPNPLAPLPALGVVRPGDAVLVLLWGARAVVLGARRGDPSWKPITLTNGWTGAASYRLIDGTVEFSGTVSHATAAQGGQIATLNLGGPALRNSGAALILNAGTGMARVSFWTSQILMYGYFNGGTASNVVLDGVRLPLA